MNCEDVKDEGVHCNFCEMLHPSDYSCDNAMLHKMILDFGKSLYDFKKKTEFNFENIHEFERVMDEGCTQLVQRIEKLESTYQSDFEKTLEVLGRLDDIDKLVNGNSYRRPHKCPICQGTGLFYNFSTLVNEKCKSCEGKCIVWG